MSGELGDVLFLFFVLRRSESEGARRGSMERRLRKKSASYAIELWHLCVKKGVQASSD